MYLATNQRREWFPPLRINPFIVFGSPARKRSIRKKKYAWPMPILDGHPNLSHPIHPFLPSHISRKHWNQCKYILASNRFFFTVENQAQQQVRAPSNSYIPKWEYLPNWDNIIQTHPLQSIPPHPPWGADKGPICIIKCPESKYIFFPPENAP